MSQMLITISNSTLQFCPNYNKLFNQSRISNCGPPRGVARMSAEPAESLYEVLGIEEKAAGRSTLLDIKKAYKTMARKYHPDVSEPDRVQDNTRRFIMVARAYQALSDPHTRASYDRNLIASKSYQGYNKEWKNAWESQIEELEKRQAVGRGRESWGSRIRAKCSWDLNTE